MKAFIESLFGYCPLIWIFHSSGVNSKINHLHERLNNISSFEDLLNPICPGEGGTHCAFPVRFWPLYFNR